MEAASPSPLPATLLLLRMASEDASQKKERSMQLPATFSLAPTSSS